MKIACIAICVIIAIVLLMAGLIASGGNEGSQEDGIDDVGPGYFD